MLLLEFGGEYFPVKQAPEIVYWYRDNSIGIQFVLLVLLAAIFIIFRKRVHYVRRK